MKNRFDTVDPSLSKYKIIMAGDNKSFDILGRSPVKIMLDGPSIRVVDKTQNTRYHAQFGLFELRKILELATTYIMQEWVPPTDKPKIHTAAESKIRAWARINCSKALGKKVASAWRSLLENANQDFVSVQRSVFASTSKCFPCLLEEEFYKNKYLVKDVAQYRAAALSLPHMHEIGIDSSIVSGGATLYGNWMNPNTYKMYTDWMSFYSSEPTPYTSLQKTLMNFPGGIPVWLVPNLATFKLERPITKRIELLTLLGINPRHQDVLYRSNEKQIRQSVQEYWVATRQTNKNFRKANPLLDVVRYISDYPEEHTGNFHGLWLKSHCWHQDGARSTYNGKYSLNKQTAFPPIPLPEDAKIQLLKTVGDIVDRGIQHRQCCGVYADECVEGRSFLFDISYKGEEATTQVSNTGRIIQSYGPRNHKNKASEYGRKKLTEWAKLWPTKKLGWATVENYPEGIIYNQDLPF